LKFLENRGNADAFEPAPTLESAAAATAPARATAAPETYTVTVNGQSYVVEVNEGGDISQVSNTSVNTSSAPAPSVGAGEPVIAPLSGTIWKVLVSAGQQVNEGDALVILEAMKMETQIVASKAGVVASLSVKEGDTVKVGDQLVAIA
jgi:oxaloacetate decarboxylase alpha subunit